MPSLVVLKFQNEAPQQQFSEKRLFGGSLFANVLNHRTKDIVYSGDLGLVSSYLKRNDFEYVAGTNGIWATQKDLSVCS